MTTRSFNRDAQGRASSLVQSIERIAIGHWFARHSDLSKLPGAGEPVASVLLDVQRHARDDSSDCTIAVTNMKSLARTPDPPYYAVVFTSVRMPADPEGYALMADRMLELAAGQPGFLGEESARDAHGVGITVSYWTSLLAIRNWREHAEHQVAQSHGRSSWYREYRLRICRVERDVHFARPDDE